MLRYYKRLSRKDDKNILLYRILNVHVRCIHTLESDSLLVSLTTGTALQLYMIAGTTPIKAPPKKPPHLSYTHYNKTGHECFLHRPKKVLHPR